MATSKAIKLVVILLLVGIGIWYFWLKDYNYKVTFITYSPQTIVYDHLTKWNDGKRSDQKVMTLLEKKVFSEVTHHFEEGDSLLKINWQLRRKNDSTTLVTARIKDENSPLLQNIKVISSNNIFVKRSVSTVKRFAESLVKNKENYKVYNVEKTVIPSKYCAYISLSSKVSDKAMTMVRHIEVMTNYIKGNNLSLDGHPFLEVTEWNIEEDSIKFDFCFPLKEKDNYPPTQRVSFKKTKSREALQVMFKGNYKISDRAWLKLKDYALFHDIEVDDLPVEVYLNDPHLGGNELDWKAEVYLPLKE